MHFPLSRAVFFPAFCCYILFFNLFPFSISIWSSFVGTMLSFRLVLFRLGANVKDQYVVGSIYFEHNDECAGQLTECTHFDHNNEWVHWTVATSSGSHRTSVMAPFNQVYTESHDLPAVWYYTFQAGESLTQLLRTRHTTLYWVLTAYRSFSNQPVSNTILPILSLPSFALDRSIGWCRTVLT